MKRNLRLEASYPYPPETVWHALTDSDSIAEWLMPNDFQPVVGHKFTMTTKPAPGFDGIVRCEVKELDPPRKLSYTWEGGGIDTVLTFTLTPEPGGTHVVLTHEGFRGLRGIMVSSMLEKGWRKKVLPKSLANVLKRISTLHTDVGSGSA